MRQRRNKFTPQNARIHEIESIKMTEDASISMQLMGKIYG